MDSTARQARLKPEFAELYPPLTADIWEPAAEMGARVLLWQLQQRGTEAHCPIRKYEHRRDLELQCSNSFEGRRTDSRGG